MKSDRFPRLRLFVVLAILSLSAAACTNDFYLSEGEAAAYTRYMATDTAMNQHFSTLQNQALQLNFDSSSTPHLISTNLLQVMRSTDMAQLETNGPVRVSLDRLNTELEAQIENWVNGRLQLYTGSNGADAHLTGLHDVHVTFPSNPSFAYHPETQSITFNAALNISIDCTIQVNALDSFANFLFSLAGNGINGTYALNVAISNLQLNGTASLLSPYADAGRVRLQMTPIPGNVQVTDSVFASGSAPGQVKDGVRNMLWSNLTSQVDEIFNQKYSYFALPQIELSSATSTTPCQLTVSYRPKPDSASPTVHLVSRANDGNLYHARKTTAGWSDFTAVPFTSKPFIANEPTLFHSGAGQLELVATDVKLNLVYGHWRDEAWGNFMTISPSQASTPSKGFIGKPAAVASAPGQVEIVAQALDGNLWYFSRWNGNWFVPYPVPAASTKSLFPPFRDPATVLVGNKLTIVFVDGKGQLGAIAFDLETNIWGQPTVIPTKEPIQFAPSAVATGDRRVDIAYVGKSNAPYYRQLNVNMAQFVQGTGTTGISIVGPETGLGAALIAGPVLVSSGYGQVELFGIQNNNAIYHMRYVNAAGPFTIDGRTVNPGWQGWMDLANNLLGVDALWTGLVDDFSAAATRTGEVELALHNSYQLVFHNVYQSARYGRDPWKTVDWRGYEYTGGNKLLGKPAVAAVDRNFELGMVTTQNLQGPGPTVAYTPQSDSNAANFTLGWAPQIMSNPNPIDPVFLSSGAGIVDQIVIATDGKIYHSRLLNGGGGSLLTLPMPSNVSIRSPLSAVGYGNGQIELVALGSDHKIYQWRYRDGAWSSASSVGGGVISAPVLMHVGAGQLELFGISTDLRLIRWRYSAGSWTGGQQIAANFSINAVLFGPSAASSWGDGTVDITVVNIQDKSLNYRRIGPGDEACGLVSGCPAPRSFINLGGAITAPPILSAFSPTHLNVLARGTDGAWYSNWSSLSAIQPVTNPPQRDLTLSWNGNEYIGGTGLAISGAVQSGRRNLAAAAIDGTGRVFINRNYEGRWTGFQPVIGQTPFMQLGPPLFMPALAAHGG